MASVIQAISPDLIAAMQANSNAETLQQVSKAIAHLAIAKNEGVAETINTIRGCNVKILFVLWWLLNFDIKKGGRANVRKESG